MLKLILAASTCLCGIALCIYGVSAFAALGITIGVGSIVCGAYLFFGFFSSRFYPLILPLTLLGFGSLMIVLCLFVDAVAFFLGGLVLAGGGIAIIPLIRHDTKIILPLCLGLIFCGIVIVFAPSFMGWLCRLVGVGLVGYSHFVVIFMDKY